MYKSLVISIVLCILGLYLTLNSKKEGKEVMDSYRYLYRKWGLVKRITKKDEESESKGAFIGGIICLLLGIYGIIESLYRHYI